MARKTVSTYSDADASPEKRLFISLITRDISLVDAVLDLIDNSINSYIISSNLNLENSNDYMKLLSRKAQKKLPVIEINISDQSIAIVDTASGISFEDAKKHVFRFGRGTENDGKNDRLSVYGIGFKRAIFKIGQQIEIVSNHKTLGFKSSIDVAAWECDKSQPWRLPIEEYRSAKDTTGTSVSISKLTEEVVTRISDNSFLSDLHDKVSRTYVYFLGTLVEISINGKMVAPSPLQIGVNSTIDTFEASGTSCSIIAGVSAQVAGKHLAENSGWFIFCNGRAVAFADKSELTGWGNLLPLFQPKHRPFLGIVFFASTNPESLPWTTTKSTVNQESKIWQLAKRRMGVAARSVLDILDERYTNEGTQLSMDDVREISGKQISAYASIKSETQQFKKPEKAKPKDTSIQYRVLLSEVEDVKEILGNKRMSNSDIGRFTFSYFYENEVDI